MKLWSRELSPFEWIVLLIGAAIAGWFFHSARLEYERTLPEPEHPAPTTPSLAA